MAINLTPVDFPILHERMLRNDEAIYRSPQNAVVV